MGKFPVIMIFFFLQIYKILWKFLFVFIILPIRAIWIVILWIYKNWWSSWTCTQSLMIYKMISNSYCPSKSLPILYSNLLYKMGHDFLSIQYITNISENSTCSIETKRGQTFHKQCKHCFYDVRPRSMYFILYFQEVLTHIL